VWKNPREKDITPGGIAPKLHSEKSRAADLIAMYSRWLSREPSHSFGEERVGDDALMEARPPKSENS